MTHLSNPSVVGSGHTQTKLVKKKNSTLGKEEKENGSTEIVGLSTNESRRVLKLCVCVTRRGEITEGGPYCLTLSLSPRQLCVCAGCAPFASKVKVSLWWSAQRRFSLLGRAWSPILITSSPFSFFFISLFLWLFCNSNCSRRAAHFCWILLLWLGTPLVESGDYLHSMTNRYFVKTNAMPIFEKRCIVPLSFDLHGRQYFSCQFKKMGNT